MRLYCEYACFAHIKLINFVIIIIIIIYLIVKDRVAPKGKGLFEGASLLRKTARVEWLLKPVSFLMAVIVWGSKMIFDATVGEYWKMVPESVFTHVCENH